MKNKFFRVVGIFLLMSVALPTMAEKLKVGFIYVGPVSDHGWSYQHELGRQSVEKRFGDQVETVFVESVPEGADSERVIRQLAAKNHQLIFTTSFGYMNPTLKVARQFSKINFEHATGYKNSRNVGNYNARFYEGRYIAAILAASMTKSKIFGYIASFPIPEVIRGINATAISARKIDPEIQIRVIWLSTWYDPAKEADAAKALIDQGADVIFQHTDSPAPLQVAEERGVWGIGQSSDMKKFAPTAQLTSIVNNWAPLYIKKVQSVLDNKWKSEDIWEGLSTGLVTMAAFNNRIPIAARRAANKAKKDIIEGNLHPFTGPINKQDGDLWVADGLVMSDGDLLKMNAYVEGIVGKLDN